MTTCDLESGLRPGIVSLNLPNTVVRLGTSAEILPHDKAAVIIDGADVSHLTRALWNGTLVIRLSSPALKREIEAHAEKLKALEAWLRNQDAVKAAYAAAGLSLVGLWVNGITALEVEDRWHGEIECRVGLVEV